MNYKRKLQKQLQAIPLPPAEAVLPAAAQKPPKATLRYGKRPIGVTVTALLLAGILAIGGVAAIPELVRYLNARQITDQGYRITEVPDGWIGIDDLDDLELLRDPVHRNTNFILMKDIQIPKQAYQSGGRYENGFLPLGTYVEKNDVGGMDLTYYEGTFHGNGYVISNLRLGAEQIPLGTTSCTLVGLFGYTSAKIIYLGLENVEIELLDPPAENDIYIGALAAKVGVVGGCYAKDVTIKLQAQSGNRNTTALGTLCGYAEYVDSCYVRNATLTVNDDSRGSILLAGGIAGTAFSCVTSFFEGSMSVNAQGYKQCLKDSISAMLYPAYMPVLLTEEAMKLVQKKLKESEADDFNYKKFMSFYQRIDLDSVDRISNEDRAERREEALLAYFEHLNSTSTALYETDVSQVRLWYVLDSATSVEELASNSQLLINAFGSAETFSAFCVEHHIKCGQLCCYSFDMGASVSREKLANFDFDRLWIETQGGVTLRAFEE